MAQISDTEKLAVGEAMIAAWNVMDWSAATALMTEDASLHSMMIEPVVGRDTIHDRFVHLGEMAESIDLKVRNMGVINGTLFMERLDTFVCNGKSGAVPVCGVLEFNGDKIAVWREYYDRNQLLSEMGLTEDFSSAEQ